MNTRKNATLPLNKRFVFYLFFLLLPVFLPFRLAAQFETNCPNSNFNTGTFNTWHACLGNFANPCQTNAWDSIGANSRQHIMPGPGTMDPNTCGKLITVYPGEAFSARLGNQNTGAQGEELKYNVTVDSTKYLFIYRYAVVLQDPGHIKENQPSFTIKVTDVNGVLLDSCGYYYVYAHAIAGWDSCGTGNNKVRFKFWTTVGMSLAAWIGQTVTITFITRDCSQGGHYGYAYISAYCSYLQMHVALCEGDSSATLTAPPGFGYLWSTGDTTESIVVPHPVLGDTYSCELTAVNNCKVTISQTITYTVIHANFTYNATCAAIPAYFYDSSYLNQNTVEGWHWDFGDGSAVVTGDPNPVHTFTNSGTYNVTLIASSSEGCKDTIVKAITVDSLPNLSNNPKRETICSGSSTNLTLTSEVTGTLFTWTATASSPNITGFSNNTTVPTNFLNQTLANSGNTKDSVTYHFTPHKNTCDGFLADFYVIVNPVPKLTNSVLVKSICDSSLTNIILQRNVAGTQFTWTCTASSLNLSGYSDNTTTPDTIINQLLRNTGFTIDTIYYHIVPHAYYCPGDTSVYKVAVYPKPDLSNPLPLTKTICSNTSPNITLTSHVTGTLFTWTCTPGSANVTGWSDNPTPGFLLNQILVNTGNNYETVTYHITPHANGCNGWVYNYVITVTPVPLLANTPNSQAQCSGLNTNIILVSNVTGVLFSWTCSPSSGYVTGWLDNLVPANQIDQILVNSGFNIETVTYHLSPYLNGCPGIAADYSVAVFPVPDLSNNPLTKTICKGNSTEITLTSNVSSTLFSWSCTGSSGFVSGFSDNPTPTTLLDQVLYNSNNVPETVTYHITPHANNCDGVPTDFVVTVNPRPVFTMNPMFKTICSSANTNLPITASCAGTTFSWTSSLVSGNITGFTNGSGNLISDVLVNSLNTQGEVLYTLHGLTAGCTGDSTYNFMVNPVPHLSNSPLTTNICSGTLTNIPLTSDVSGASFSWTASGSSGNVLGFTPGNALVIAQTLTNSGFNIETVTYHITAHANGCDGPVTDFAVTVFPVADVYFQPATQSLCSGLTTNVTILSHVAGSSFTWVASGSSGSISGYSNDSGNSIGQVLVNSGNINETVTYLVTPVANGCTGTSFSMVITVYPVPHVTTTPLAQTICTANSFSVNLLSSVTGSTFSWTCSSSSSNLSGYSAGTGSTLSQTLTNSGFTIETVTYHITPHANGCDGPVTDYIVTVNPKPDVSNNPMSSQICSATSPNINLTSNVAGTNFSWTATGSSPNIIGYGSGSGLIINQVLTNLGFNTEFATYHLTPTANSCSGLTVDYVVTIVQVPDVYFNPTSQTICSLQTTNIQNLSHVTGSTFTWTASSSSANLMGFSGGTGNIIAQTITNSGNTIETVTYTVSPSAFGCPAGIPSGVIVTVNPKPAITNNTTTSQICNNTSTNIVPQSSVPGSTYSWTAIGSSSNVTGFSAGSGLTIIQTLHNTGFNIETVTYAVTPHANSCPGNIVSFVVTVFPVADVYFSPTVQTICAAQTTNIQILSHVFGSTYIWTAGGSSPNVIGYTPGSGNVIQQTLNNSGYMIETVTYLVTPSANGCTGTSNNVVVTVDPAPVVSFTTCWDPVMTTAARSFTLKGGLPLGGGYAGPGINAGIFYPGIAGAGTHTITYSYTNGFTCTRTSNQTISIISPPAFLCGNTLIDIRDNQQYPTVNIGGQCWTAGNLNYGNVIVSTLMQRDNCTPEKYCFNDNPANCTNSGALYQWDEMMKFDNIDGDQGFCPSGWHIPKESEWTTLFNFYISNGFAGSLLKSTGYSGFNALLDGIRHENVVWDFNNFATMFWSSTAHGPNKAWAHGMNSFNPSVSYYPSLRSNAFYVRCLKD